MDDDLIARAMPQSCDPCPPSLRTVLERWKAGKATNAELIEASYYAQLDLLAEYRRRPLPTPPGSVWAYRSLSQEERRAWSDNDRAQLCRQHQAFFDQEQQIVNRNRSNFLMLQELLAWAKGNNLPESITLVIEAQIAQHHDETIDEPEPMAV